MDKRFLILIVSVLVAAGLTVFVAATLAGGPQALLPVLPVTVLAALLLHLMRGRG